MHLSFLETKTTPDGKNIKGWKELTPEDTSQKHDAYISNVDFTLHFLVKPEHIGQNIERLFGGKYEVKKYQPHRPIFKIKLG